MQRALAFDFNISSGRAVIGSYDNHTISLTEIHCFEYKPVMADGMLQWDLPTLMTNIKTGLKKAFEAGGIDSVGIDAWGVDFGLIGPDGKLLENPVHHDDKRTDHMIEEVFEVVPKQALYKKTGIQIMQHNTIFQLFYLKKYRPELLAKTKKMLFIPDLLTYLLTNVMKTEYTVASTSQMLNPYGQNWDYGLLTKLDIPERILCLVEHSPISYGTLSDDICQELNLPKTAVFSVASHSAASAVAAVPVDVIHTQHDFVYIDCGAYACFGTETDMPVINEQSAANNWTNEGAFGGRIRFTKSMMGMAFIEEIWLQYCCEHPETSFKALEQAALSSPPFKCFVDPDAVELAKPGSINDKLKTFCDRTKQSIPENTGEMIRCIYESLALKFRYTLLEIERLTGKKYPMLYIIGNGSVSKLLCQMTADCCGIPVSSGPVDAAVMGNISAQLIASGAIQDLNEARSVIRNSTKPALYLPRKSHEWEIHFDAFAKLL